MAMTKEEILHLATLARIELTDEEVLTFGNEIEAILGYVEKVQYLAKGIEEVEILPPLRNILRTDEVTNAADEYTEAMISMAPKKTDRFVEVQKIIPSDA